MLEIIPNTVDPDGSALLAFLDKEELARHLNLFLSDQGQRASLPDARIRVLRWHKKNRCTMEITLETYGIFHELIGKIYAANRSDTYRMMKTMWREGFDSATVDVHVLPSASSPRKRRGYVRSRDFPRQRPA